MFLESVAAAGVRLAAPIVLASVGETFSQRAGVVNIQLEGTMLVGAFTGVLGAYYFNDPWIGLCAAVAGGLVVALLHSLVTIKLAANQVVSGIGLNLLALGVTSFLLDAFYGGVQLTTPGFGPLRIPGLAGLPAVGDIFFTQKAGIYLVYLIVPLSVFLMYRTSWGLKVTACGANPLAADTMGVNVNWVRFQAVLLTGALAGLAGGILALAELGFFVDNMIQGNGFIALAAVLLGNWRPGWVALAALFFGFVVALQLRLQTLGIGIPPEAMSMLPYVLTLIVLAAFVGRSRPPAHFARPYIRGKV